MTRIKIRNKQGFLGGGGVGPIIYFTLGKYANHIITEAVQFIKDIV